jgi:hypothetical protein
MLAVGRKSPQQEQVHELIVTLRKALSQQKHLEESCQRANLPIDYRWSLNHPTSEPVSPEPVPAEPISPEPIASEPVSSSESCHP